MEYLFVVFISICYISGWIAYRVYKLTEEVYKKYQFKQFNLIQVGIFIYLFIFPFIVLSKNYGLETSLPSHVGGLLICYFIADYFISAESNFLSWGLILFFMGLGGVSSFLLGPFAIKDGVYCAHVQYYNPDTDRKRLYILTVVVEENKVIKIDFPEGGWLDEDHFDPEPFDKNGEVTITDDRDYEYTISHLKKGECE